MLACHAAPAAFSAALYFIDIRYQVFGGGTANGPGVYADSLAWVLGLPPRHLGMASTSLPAVVLFIAALWILRREKSDSWIFFAGVILVVPVLLAVFRHSEVLYVRHFMIGMAFLLVLFSFVLAALYQRGWLSRLICVLLLAGYFTLNGWHTVRLFKYGRGHYAEAARFLAEHTKRAGCHHQGDHNFRIEFVLQFYTNAAMGNKTARYYGNSPAQSWSKVAPEWLITHKESFEDPSPPAEQFAMTPATSTNL